MPPRSTGLPQPIQLESIVGSVDRSRDFDRSFRPASSKVRARWERIGQVYFVRDGHHRVSVARALGEEYVPAVELLRDAGLIDGRGTETDAYMALTTERYRLLQSHEWSGEAIDRVRQGG